MTNSNQNNSQAIRNKKNNKAGYIRKHIWGHYKELNITKKNS